MNPPTDSNTIGHHDLRDGQVSPSVAASCGAEHSHQAHSYDRRPTSYLPRAQLFSNLEAMRDELARLRRDARSLELIIEGTESLRSPARADDS
jgi:hypothetical protein